MVTPIEAERVAHHYALEQDPPPFMVHRAKRSGYGGNDVFDCDVVALYMDGSKLWADALSGGDRARQKKERVLEAYPWHASDRVVIVQVRTEPDPDDGRRVQDHVRVHRLVDAEANRARDRWRVVEDRVSPREWRLAPG